MSTLKVNNIVAYSGTHVSGTFSGVFSGSFNSNRIDALEAFSSSLDNTFATDLVVNSLSGAFNSFTAALDNTYATDAQLLPILQATASLNTYTGSNDSVVATILQTTASLNSNTGSYATTGSNTFIGNQTISGSLNVNGFVYKDGNKQFNYGQWASLETQTGSANTAYAMKLETQTDGVSGFYVGNNASGFPTRIYTQHTGLYNLQFSAQLHTTLNQACDFSVWFAMTGSNMDNSNTDFSIEKVSGGGFQVAALNFLTPITSGSYVELYWSKTTANGQLQYKGTQVSPTRPATPSVIVTVTQVA